MIKITRIPKLYVYQKVIIVFAALIIPVYIVNLLMNMMGQSFIKQEFSDSIQSKVQFYSNQLDDQISFIRNQQLQAVNDSELQKLNFLSGTLDVFEEIQLVNRVKERLSTIQNSSEYLLNTGVYMKSFGRTISTQSGINKLPNQEYEIISKLYLKSKKSSIYYYEGRLFFIEAANNSSVIVYMELSVKKLEKTLEQLVGNYGYSGAFITNESFSYYISPKHEDAIVKKIYDNVSLEANNKNDESHILKLGDQSYRITYNRISTLGLTLYSYINQNELTGSLKTFNIWLLVMSLISIVIILVFSFSVKLMIHNPLKELIAAFRTLETDNLDILIRPKNDIEFGYLYRSFDKLIDKLRQSIRQNYEQKMALQHSELKQLQSQIKPHFLYNGFFNIYMMCKAKDYETVATLAQKLGSYYQFVTRNGADEVPFDMEYRHAMDYVEIQRIRFSNRIHVVAGEIPDACKPLMVPRLILQPIIENTFEHAFENERKGGNIRITVTYEKKCLRVCVEDDGNKLTDDLIHSLQEKLAHSSIVLEKTGIINVCRRIQLEYGKPSGVFVSRSEHGGLKAEVIIHFNYGGGSDV
ncbi:sensor histidine kinase YesM [Paenibacillus marchantiophytorum]|uniref:Sensor histidine kinase YesM n=1 Tax=Paenibacillus marchantiophytorum TaxID=1619310 RepID=A0ABQ2BRH6_9BACL|nr:histidine kinase [Paenibacillus marchantiophytorum]GGI45841.1 sensor histidine kinase YesM [Paenibacillus marchantiophytorum]